MLLAEALCCTSRGGSAFEVGKCCNGPLRQSITFLLRCLFVEPISSRGLYLLLGGNVVEAALDKLCSLLLLLLTEAMSSFAVVPLWSFKRSCS